MFKPNQRCSILLASKRTDVYGRPLPGRRVNERCSVVFVRERAQQTSVRADSSATRGNAQEMDADARLLLTTNTQASIDDIIEVAGVVLKIAAFQPRFNARGVLDHYEVDAHMWSHE